MAMARGWTAAMAMALLGVAAGRSTLPLRVPATGAEVLALPPALLERLWAQENGVAMIVGGEEVDPPFKYPWQADIFFKTSGHLCGGSLFNETWILTAAHCMIATTPRNIGVQVHRHDLSLDADQEDGEVRDVIEIFLHPDYVPLRYNRDVALIHLASPIVNIPLVTLDARGDYQADGTLLTVTGWGALTEGGRSPDALHEVTVPVVNQTVCNDNYDGGITEFMICGGYPEGGKDSCQGDSGGPWFTNDGVNPPVQVGIVSWGDGCARPDKPGVYTRISSVYDFISDTINGKSKVKSL